ncbi:DUF4410 domain-containing protein [Gluconobacter sp. R75690]|uniref:DUF4410 domain-containing protein n=1 Tax=Gluconobacter TaxID=441 RepID=UPI00188A9BDB|nr:MULTISPECIES: DUF4410 domain-containing protein [unclassified Gluconobacter]MBF0851788.1 DUF4410 domain-containing protein [Gluconobacter sp. R75690]MBF0880501.1 DUF4410 domain-containing protein [Gluconobacter sp. R75828]
MTHAHPTLVIRGTTFAKVASMLTLLVLGGCAGATVSHRQPGAVVPFAALSPPDVVFVAVTGPDATISQADATLASSLIPALRKAGIPAALQMPGISDPAYPILRVTLASVDPGNAMERTMIGFGAGRSTLAAHIRLDDPRRVDRAPATAFDINADSGRKPGLIVPAAVTLGTAVPIHMAIGGGLNLLLGRRQGTDADLHNATGAITREVLACYRAMGWSVPA